jgi:hypothetical protein
VGNNPVNFNDPDGLVAREATNWATQKASYFGNFIGDPDTATGILEGAVGTALVGGAIGGDIAAGLPTFGTGSMALAPAASAVAALGSGLVLDAGQRLAGAISRASASDNIYYSESSEAGSVASRRAQNPGDLTLPTERAARREAIRQGGGQVSIPNGYVRAENKDKNPNLRGPNNERAEDRRLG